MDVRAPTEPTVAWIEKKFADTPGVGAANLAAFRAGYNFGETAELLAVHYEVDAAPAPPGTYRNVNGTQALAYGLVAAAVQSGLGLFYASYPITPASSCCTRCRATTSSACARSRPRTRSPR